MLFNSIEFLLFVPIVFSLYWYIQRFRLSYQNFFILIASYTFYGWWDVRFLTLIIISSIVDYFVGLRLDREERIKARKLLLAVSVLCNLGILGFFKYFNFFIGSFEVILAAMGIQANSHSLQVILPVGISFYTFQTMSYTIDIYKRKIHATDDFMAFFAFVSFFPQLVAGPIERAKNLLPQFVKKREFDHHRAIEGLRQILWGMLKKVVIADNLADYVNLVFSSYQDLGGITLILGTFFFAIQIYCDFSGYSDIAIGTAKLFGFSIMRNFAYPYFSRDIAEFWRRWHISLSTWFRDYLFIPIGGSRVGKTRHIYNILTTFTVSGLWHGANWTFVTWGFLNGLYYVPRILVGKKSKYTEANGYYGILPSLKELIQITITFSLILFAWIFFRAESMTRAIQFITQIFTNFGYESLPGGKVKMGLLYSFFLLVVEWFQRHKSHGLAVPNIPLFFRWSLYFALLSSILILGHMGKIEFIYF